MLTVAAALLPKYLDPVLRSQLSKSEHLKLYHKLQPHLVRSMVELSCSPALNPTLDIPYNLRILLVCSFLASHNPARLDKRFFCKGKSSKRKARSRGGSKISEALKGPKTFPLDRLLAIHSSVAQVRLLAFYFDSKFPTDQPNPVVRTAPSRVRTSCLLFPR